MTCIPSGPLAVGSIAHDRLSSLGRVFPQSSVFCSDLPRFGFDVAFFHVMFANTLETLKLNRELLLICFNPCWFDC